MKPEPTHQELLDAIGKLRKALLEIRWSNANWDAWCSLTIDSRGEIKDVLRDTSTIKGLKT